MCLFKNVQTAELSHGWNFLSSVRTIIRHASCFILGLCIIGCLTGWIDAISIYYRLEGLHSNIQIAWSNSQLRFSLKYMGLLWWIGRRYKIVSLTFESIKQRYDLMEMTDFVVGHQEGTISCIRYCKSKGNQAKWLISQIA